MGELAKLGATFVERFRNDDRGLNTAELLGNAALAIVALIAIWAGLRALGVDLIAAIRDLLFEDL